MILLWLITPLLRLLQSIIGLLPVADFEPLTAAVAPLTRLVSWVGKLNEAFPVTELLGALGVIAGVYVALYGVMLVRRVFSLFWPGAGS